MRKLNYDNEGWRLAVREWHGKHSQFFRWISKSYFWYVERSEQRGKNITSSTSEDAISFCKWSCRKVWSLVALLGEPCWPLPLFDWAGRQESAPPDFQHLNWKSTPKEKCKSKCSEQKGNENRDSKKWPSPYMGWLFVAGLYTLTPKKYRCAFISVAESISSNCLHIRYQESGQDRNMLGAVWENEVLTKYDNLLSK